MHLRRPTRSVGVLIVLFLGLAVIAAARVPLDRPSARTGLQNESSPAESTALTRSSVVEASAATDGAADAATPVSPPAPGPLQVVPRRLNFGRLAEGTSAERTVLLRNVLFEPEAPRLSSELVAVSASVVRYAPTPCGVEVTIRVERRTQQSGRVRQRLAIEYAGERAHLHVSAVVD